ncbi:universal stress protein [Paenarthrobacter sp. S56]|uniref:universal stress protein n=1 Tax=Paenarthrobacter sp. S56 TaxID=3138179 RepID=UPI00321AD76F
MNSENNADRVIVGVDGSDFSSKTLEMAARVAPVFGVPISVITCVGMSDYYLSSRFEHELTRFTSELEDTAQRLAEEALDRAFDGSRPEGLTVTVKFGEPAKVLVEESRGARLLVVGRHGGGGFLGQAIGSVSRACAAHAHCPVLLVTGEEG